MSAPKRVALYGLGKAGSALFRSFDNAGVKVVALSSRSTKTRRAFEKSTGEKTQSNLKVWLERALSKNAQVLFLAVSDDAIEHVANAIATELPSENPPLVVHLSGALGLHALDALKDFCPTGVFHLLASLSEKHPVPQKSVCGICASDEPSKRALLSLANKIELEGTLVNDTLLYHAGAVLSGNLTLALLSMGTDALERAGFERSRARVALARLMKSAAERAIERDIDEALTGPLARGDARTISLHLGALDDEDAELYRALSLKLLESISPSRRDELMDKLSK